MTPENKSLLEFALDFLFNSCQRDADGNLRSDSERIKNYTTYIGWLESKILHNFTDDQAVELLEKIKIWKKEDLVDEDHSSDLAGSFY